MRLLIVEDDRDMRQSLVRGLVERAYAVDAVGNGEEALERAAMNSYDAIVLDVSIPAPDGFEVCRRLRRDEVQTPILMLTARDTVSDRVAGLDSGSDDYLVKPFEFAELLARLRALIRRGGSRHDPVLEIVDLSIDTRSHRTRRGGEEMALTTKEYTLLEFLALNQGRVVGREEIAEHVWNEDYDPFSNLIEVYIGRLRRNIDRDHETKLIHTIRGAGYILEPRTQAGPQR
jgi:DNA-binding response OmpR family regulator